MCESEKCGDGDCGAGVVLICSVELMWERVGEGGRGWGVCGLMCGGEKLGGGTGVWRMRSVWTVEVGNEVRMWE